MSEPLVKLRFEALEWRLVEGEVVALDLRDSVFYEVNRTGASLWPSLAAGITRTDLIDHLADAAGIDREQAGVEVDGFLGSLAELNLLETPCR